MLGKKIKRTFSKKLQKHFVAVAHFVLTEQECLTGVCQGTCGAQSVASGLPSPTLAALSLVWGPTAHSCAVRTWLFRGHLRPRRLGFGEMESWV